MMLKKYVQPCADTSTSASPDLESTASPCATVTSVPITDEVISQTAPDKSENAPTVNNEKLASAIDKHLATNCITVLEKHYPEIESELNEIGYLLNGIAEHIGEAEDLIHTLRKAIAESDGKFTYNPKKLSAEQRESVHKVMLLLKQCGIFSEVTILNTYSGMVSTATRVRSFISGLWLELFSQQHGIEIISEIAKQLNLPYEVLCNVKVADKEGVQHEIDLMFSIGDKVFAIEQKSGVNFFDYDRYRLLAEYLHLIPDRFMLVNSTLLDKDATKCITYFYRYYICNSADYMSTLSAMIDKAFNS